MFVSFSVSGECLVCSLKLCEQISTSNQGLMLFECGKLVYVLFASGTQGGFILGKRNAYEEESREA